jgi:hypothetical protein
MLLYCSSRLDDVSVKYLRLNFEDLALCPINHVDGGKDCGVIYMSRAGNVNMLLAFILAIVLLT